MSCIHVQTDSMITTLTLSRPEAANALNRDLLIELQEILHNISNDTEVRAVILTGSGEKAFCAGADLKERMNIPLHEVRQAVDLIGETVNMVEALPQPVIAAINGVAFGGGLELALACDIRLAAEHVKVGLTETSLAILPGAGGTQRLPRIIGISRAKEWIYTAKRVDAEEALEAGLLTRIVAKDQLEVTARLIAQQIANQGPLAVRQAKRAIDEGMQGTLAAGLEIEAKAYDAIIYTEDRVEGLMAFQEKRPPVYIGK